MKTVAFSLYTDAGSLDDQAIPTFLYYGTIGGAVRTPPAIVHTGDARYNFIPTDADIEAGVVYLIDTGSNPIHFVGGLGRSVAILNYENGELGLNTGSPAFVHYSNAETGEAVVFPSLEFVTEGLHAFDPGEDVPVEGIIYRLEFPAGDTEYFDGTVTSTAVTVPTVSGVTPAPGATLGVIEALGFDVSDEGRDLGRVVIAIQYTNYGGTTELAWDGDAVVTPYQVTSLPIENGRRYTVLRKGGWKGPFTLRVFATDLTGNEL
jgi:hypothetical protein